ncbi:MAG: glycosyl transferase family 28 [Alphaproteobacteria bacterium]|nr:glycosyl transferase family 28 [Alphaproteobacteria bacterium]
MHPDGQPTDASWQAERARQVLAAFDRLAPDILLIELFPFGRRLIEFELLPLIERAVARTPRPLLACSIRDVLAFKPDPAKRQRMVDRARRWFDVVLFHGDSALLPLARSLPEADALADRIVETGYVRNQGSRRTVEPTPTGEIVVSAGGGAVGTPLIEAALAAREISRERDRPWRILVAGTGILPRIEPGLVVEPNRPDFSALLASAHLSVSQAGYNTVVDLLESRVRALLVPFAVHAETEQSLRAEALAQRGIAAMLAESELSPARLAAAIDAAAARPRPDHHVRLDGAASSAAALLDRVGA